MLVPATVVVAADHFLRGVYWPQSVYGILVASQWRWLEHAGWVVFEDIVLVSACLRSQTDMERDALRTAKLEVSESRFEDAQALAHIGSWEWDIVAGQGAWSAEQFRIFGLEPDGREPSPATYCGLVHPEDRGRVEQLIERAVQRGDAFDCEHRLVRPDLEVRIVHARVHLVADAQGAPVKVVGTAQDITERRRAEEELREKTSALEHAAEGIARLDGGGRYVSVNRSYAAMLGCAPQELVGASWHGTVAADDLPLVQAAFERMLVDGKVVAQARGRRKDGLEFHKEVVLIAVGEPGGRDGHYCFVKDITERKRIEQELAEARDAALEAARLKTRVPGQHEPRDPHADERRHRHDRAAARDPARRPSSASSSRPSQSSAESLLTIINDILDFSKIEAGKLAFETLDFDLRPIVEDTVDLLAERAARQAASSWSSCDGPARAARRCAAIPAGCARS